MAKSADDGSRKVAFFLSYARKDIDARRTEFDTFSKELDARVKVVTGDAAEGFWDAKIEQGNDWQRRIDEALSRCIVFVALVSPNYLNSEECRREWDRFARRVSDRAGDGCLVPVIWVPSFGKLPHEVKTLQFARPNLGPTYVKKGLSHQIEHAAEEFRRDFLPSLVEHMVGLVRAEPPPSRRSTNPFEGGAVPARSRSSKPPAAPGASRNSKSMAAHQQVTPGDFGSAMLVHHYVSKQPINGDSVQRCFETWTNAVKHASKGSSSVDYLQLSIENQRTIYPDLNDMSAMGQTIWTLRGILEPRSGDWKPPFFHVLDRIHSHHYFSDRFTLVVDKRKECLKAPASLDLLGPTVYLHLTDKILESQTKDSVTYFRIFPEAKSEVWNSIRVASPLCWETMVQYKSSYLRFPQTDTPIDCHAGCGQPKHRLGDYLEGCFKEAIVESLLRGMACFSINNLRERKNAKHASRHILYSAVRAGNDFVGGIVLYSRNGFTAEANQLADAYKLAMLSTRSPNGDQPPTPR